MHRLPVQVDVEAFDFFFSRHAQPDQGVDDLEEDEGGDGAPGDADQRAPQLGQDLAGIAVDQALLAVARDRFAGAILTGVFAVEAIAGDGKKGLIDGNPGQVLTQLWGSLVCIAWCAIATFIILKIVDALIGLRVTTEEEIEGLDINLHGETVH